MKSDVGYIYGIHNSRYNKIYIGQTKNIKRRFADHKYMLLHNKHTNKDLQNDYNNGNLQDFEFYIIEKNVASNELLEQEKYWIDYYGGIDADSNYNMTNYKHLNYKVKLYIGNSNKGKKRNVIYKQEMSLKKNCLYKNNTSIRTKISNSLKEYYLSNSGMQRRKQLQQFAQQHYSGSDNPMYGKKHKSESIDKIKQHKLDKEPWNKGKVGLYKASDETKQKQCLASTKYSKKFIEQLKDDYYELKTYKAVADKYNMNAMCVSRLIRFGSTKIPNRTCND